MILEFGTFRRLSRMASRKCSSGDATRSEMGIVVSWPLLLADSLLRIASGAFDRHRGPEIRQRHGRQSERCQKRAVFVTGNANGDRVGDAARGTIRIALE